jgi:hypothetical protein
MGHAEALGQPKKLGGTQSFVGTMSTVWRRPTLTGLEIAWRWLYGVPACALGFVQVKKLLLAATDGTLDPARLGLDKVLLNDPVGALSADPLGATSKFSGAIGLVLPELIRLGTWLLPLLVVGWVVASSLGRTLVLRKADPDLRARPATLMVLQALRVSVLAAIFLVWFRAVEQIGWIAVVGPIAAHEEPNLILYCAMLIVLSLGMFTVWGFLSWYLSIAPLLAMGENLGPWASLKAAGRLGGLRAKLVEINLVLSIVKIALLVLAMVFSATPLPFEDVTTPEFLAWWWAGVTLIYLVWSDFFHVARLVSYLDLWRGVKKNS